MAKNLKLNIKIQILHIYLTKWILGEILIKMQINLLMKYLIL